MEFPTIQEIKNWVATGDPHITDKFEFAFKTQLFYLYQGGVLAQSMAAQLKKMHTQAQLDSYKKFLDVLRQKYLNWLNIQHEIEVDKPGLALGLKGGDIFDKVGIQKIKIILNRWSQDKVGIGFIPLIIGAVTGLIALWGIYKISERFTTTVQDKEELLAQTQKTVSDLGLNPDQAAKLLGDTQAQANEGSGIGDIIKYALLGFLGIQLIPMFTNKK